MIIKTHNKKMYAFRRKKSHVVNIIMKGVQSILIWALENLLGNRGQNEEDKEMQGFL